MHTVLARTLLGEQTTTKNTNTSKILQTTRKTVRHCTVCLTLDKSYNKLDSYLFALPVHHT